MDCSLPGSSLLGILQEDYWSELPFPSPEDLPNPGIEPTSLMFLFLCSYLLFLHWQAGSLPLTQSGKHS